MSKVTKYKRDFLKANRVTARQFELKYIAFMESNPDEQAYRAFAQKWNITIHRGLGDPESEALLSVNIAAIKVLSENEDEARAKINEILQSLEQ
jgi:hypothetical protein